MTFARPALESVALTDIVMNLFLFFFITFNLFSTFHGARESSLKIALPSVSKDSGAKEPVLNQINLTASGDIYWNKTKVSPGELKKNLAAEGRDGRLIPLHADRGASVQMLVDLLETVRESGSKNVVLATRLENELPKAPAV